MTKILTVNDIHLTDRAPSSATESYVDDLFELLHQVALVAKKLKVDATVWAGDVFHHKAPMKTSHSLVLRTIEAAKEFDNLWVIAGNHDLTQDRLDSLFDRQPLGVLLKSGAAQYLDGWHPSLPLFGVQWQQDWHEGEARMRAFEDWRSSSADLANSLVVTHAPLYPAGQENEFDHIPTLGDDGISVAMGNTGYLTYGHIHEDHGIFEVEGVKYANHGALSRGSLHEYNRTREIAVTLWDSTKGFVKVPIPHKPADEVFRLAEVDAEKAEKLSLEEFLEDVGQTTFEVANTESIVAHIKTLAIEDRVKKTAIDLIEEKS